MLINNILKVRKEVLRLSRLKFSLRTGISEHTLRRIEKNQLAISERMKIKLLNSFEKNGVKFNNDFSDFKIISNKNFDGFEIELKNEKRIDSFIFLMKRIYNDICYYKILDDRYEGVFSKFSIVFGNKKIKDYHNFLGAYCLIHFKRRRSIKKKNMILRKIKSIERNKGVIEFEKLMGEKNNINLKIDKIEYICPIFCVRSYCDYYD
ncbi:hypothetical protein [Fluviispira multicolorata]|uniref:Uncharacterized protein n=1 Tax=Fluviispira multicolorata TaxID=2654512 RepID=A0A833JEW6_9BACT|nr:hypothetical protein [Fluviispira multicolorata]KAB8030689.1 hypothetical protein GCL57_06860 [Fluviispira multicolorata]